MKLYRINCYGNSYALANSQMDAIKFYLNNYQELKDIPEISSKLRAELIMNDAVLKSILPYNIDKLSEITHEIVRALRFCGKQHLERESVTILNKFIHVFEGRSIYGPIPDTEHFINFEGSIDKYLVEKSEIMFSNTLLPQGDKLLEFLGFWQIENGDYQIDDEYSGKSFLYTSNALGNHRIDVYEDTGIEAEFITSMTLGEFIDKYIK